MIKQNQNNFYDLKPFYEMTVGENNGFLFVRLPQDYRKTAWGTKGNVLNLSIEKVDGEECIVMRKKAVQQ